MNIMASKLARRGPDAQGIHCKGRVGLGHRRLKIIDLTDAANQPFLSDDGRIALVFNGEIYNFRELRAELEESGHRFRTQSDTEVVLQMYERYGKESFRRFNGMYAFGILDSRTPTPVLYLVRDRFGVKPLFYSFDSGRLAFASDLKPLLTLDWIRREVDLNAVHQLLTFSHVPTPASILKSVRQLVPGTWLRYDGETLDHGVYRVPERSRKDSPVANGGFDQALEEFDRVLHASVRRQIVSDVPVGCFLSGGVDSSLLTIAYTDISPGRPIETFSIGYAEPEYDETPFAKTIATAFGTRHHEIKVGPRDYIDLIPEVPEYFDQPFADPTLLSSLLLARFSRKDVTVALSGDGGDELFFGYPHQKAILHLRKLAFVPRAIRRAVFESAGGTARILSGVGMGGKALHQFSKLSEMLQFANEAELFQYFIGMIGPMRSDRIAELFVDAKSLGAIAPLPLVDELKNAAAFERIEQVFMKTFLLDTVLTKTDRATMAYGLEARVPFLDDEMVEFAASVPAKFKLRHGKSKYLLRQLFERKLKKARVATDLSQRRKQGFSIPMRDWLKDDLKYLLDEYLHEPRLKRDGIFNPGAIKALVRQHLGNQANHSHLLWTLISFQMWMETYLG